MDRNSRPLYYLAVSILVILLIAGAASFLSPPSIFACGEDNPHTPLDESSGCGSSGDIAYEADPAPQQQDTSNNNNSDTNVNPQNLGTTETPVDSGSDSQGADSGGGECPGH